MMVVPAVLRPLVAKLRPVRCDRPIAEPRAAIYSLTPPLTVERGGTVQVKLALRNLGHLPWSGTGRCPVQLRGYWKTSRKQGTEVRDAVVPLPHVVHGGHEIQVYATLPTPPAVGQYLIEFKPEQVGGSDFQISKSAWIDVQVVAPAIEEIDYHKVYATADLDHDYWTVVGPASKEEFHRLSHIKVQQLVEQGLTPDSQVLDVGCGTGQLAAGLESYLSDRGGYFGTDVGPEAIEFCQRKYTRSNFAFSVNDFTKLPVGNRRFDCACFFSVFTHTYPDETALLLAETAKSLNPNGFILGDVFTSPLTDRCAGNRGAVEVNRDHLLRLADLAGLKVETVSNWAWKDHARREVMRFTRR